MPHRNVVTTYVNPDTDGVIGAIVFAHYADALAAASYTALCFGALDEETVLVLSTFGLQRPADGPMPDSGDIVLIDTHHPAQLPEWFPCERVVDVIDHHPNGSPGSFPNASIQNEQVGAAVTILVERIQAKGIEPSLNLRLSLAAAIVSNTLNFTGPSTTVRDQVAYAWLTGGVGLSVEFLSELLSARSAWLRGRTEDAIRQGAKAFDLVFGRSVIVQLEGAGVQSFLERPDLLNAIAAVRDIDGWGDAAVILSLVDFQMKETLLYCPSRAVAERVAERTGALMVNEHLAKVPRILLRKTDLVPALSVL